MVAPVYNFFSKDPENKDKLLCKVYIIFLVHFFDLSTIYF